MMATTCRDQDGAHQDQGADLDPLPEVHASPYSASAFFIIASDASGPLKPTRYSSRIGAKHS